MASQAFSSNFVDPFGGAPQTYGRTRYSDLAADYSDQRSEALRRVVAHKYGIKNAEEVFKIEERRIAEAREEQRRQANQGLLANILGSVFGAAGSIASAGIMKGR